jgi:hypothetical protein
MRDRIVEQMLPLEHMKNVNPGFVKKHYPEFYYDQDKKIALIAVILLSIFILFCFIMLLIS